ncbi:alpha-glucosidase [Aureobasidium sp. EXF-10728]|nr:alpha-glucosidase [Aureobasidium sp. EXF-10728]
MVLSTGHPWWKDSVVYQVYPASFKDSNDDGIGDLPGIISKLDYIQDLGVDVVWICPISLACSLLICSHVWVNPYSSGRHGQVHPPYGTLDDMERLISECHSRKMRVVLDLVVNHTSDQHDWFRESRSSRDSPKRDWYIWKPATYIDGKRCPPTNWRSHFGGSTWEWDEHTQEYYLHLFSCHQPDLNWDNEATRAAIYQDTMVFWLEKGVDGFRVDCVNMYSKPAVYTDVPAVDSNAVYQSAGSQYCNGPNLHEYLREVRAILAPYDAMTVGECPNTDMATVLSYVGASQAQLDMVLLFDVVNVGMGTNFKYDIEPFAWQLADFKSAISRTQSLTINSDGWTTVFLENHDQSRSISRYGSDDPAWRTRSGKMLALMNASLTGTLFLYQGQELGMVNLPPDVPIEVYKDVESIEYIAMVRKRCNDDPEEMHKAQLGLQYLARDHARSPMQWNADVDGGGFSNATPWMKVNPLTKEINASQQVQDQDSVLNFWKLALKIRKEHPALVHGNFEWLDLQNSTVFSFTKTLGEQRILIVCNFPKHAADLPALGLSMQGQILGNILNSAEHILEPWEGRIYSVA